MARTRSSGKIARASVERPCRAKFERLHPGHGKVEKVPDAVANSRMQGAMLIPRPLDVDALVRRIRYGRLVTTGQIRARLAADAGADKTCPLTTGVFLRLVAEAAEEDRAAGVAVIAPYWRITRGNGELNDKIPGGVAAKAAKLRREGCEIGTIGRSAKLKVLGFATRLAKR